MNENETEYSIEEDSITRECSVEKGFHKKFLNMTDHRSMGI